MSQDQIRYDVLVQEALRGVVRKVLAEVIQTGLPGDHHFYISFDTQHPGVRISSRLRQRYPEEMTIVLQHQYWDLILTDTTFEVGLSFGGIPERLLVPFIAIKGFFDPSVQFGLQFEVHRDTVEDKKEPTVGMPPVQAAVRPAVSITTTASSEIQQASETQDRGEKPGTRPDATPAPTPAAVPVAKAEPAADDKPAATVVSLDSFRKKP